MNKSTRRITNRIAIFLSLFCAQISAAQVTFERLKNSAKEPQNWMTYSGDYSGKRFSALDQINTSNAKAMTVKWVYQTGATGKITACSFPWPFRWSRKFDECRVHRSRAAFP